MSESLKRVSRRCKKCVTGVSRGCQDHVDKGMPKGCQVDIKTRRVSLGCQEGFKRVSGTCTEGVKRVSRRCHEVAMRLPSWYQEGVKRVSRGVKTLRAMVPRGVKRPVKRVPIT